MPHHAQRTAAAPTQHPSAAAASGPRSAALARTAQLLNSSAGLVAQRRLGVALSRAAPVQRARRATSPPTPVVQRVLDPELQGLEDAFQQTDDPLLRKLLLEARQLSDIELSEEEDPEQAHARRLVKGDRRAHAVNLDPAVAPGDPVTRQSLLLHEMIHVSADRKYNANAMGEPDPALTAVVTPGKSDDEKREEIGAQMDYRRQQAMKLQSGVAKDKGVPDKVKDLVADRMDRIIGAPHREFDSVVTELYFVLSQTGASRESMTFRTIAAMADAAHRSRNEGVPLEQVYQEPAEEKSSCVIQ